MSSSYVEMLCYVCIHINYKEHGTGKEEHNLWSDSTTNKLYYLSEKLFNHNCFINTTCQATEFISLLEIIIRLFNMAFNKAPT